MEVLSKSKSDFLSKSYGDSSGSVYGSGYGGGDGYGDGYGDGNGYGNGNGDGSGYGYGNGDGNGDGSGDGSGHSNGYGYSNGDGCGYGYGDGNGNGCGYGNGLMSFREEAVHYIDSVPTVLRHTHGNIASGYVVNDDLTTTRTYVVKQNGMFAHGRTIREAMNALQCKLLNNMPIDERVALFIQEYPTLDTMCKNADLFDWHNRLTGSCLQGRKKFQKDRGLSLDDSITVAEFIELTKDSYGGDVISKLEEAYTNDTNN